MKKILTLFAVVGLIVFSSCEGPEGPEGPPGLLAEVFETNAVSFNTGNNFSISVPLNPAIYETDMVLVYRLAGIDGGKDVWKLLPETYYFADGTRDFGFNFDFTNVDIGIFMEGNDLASVATGFRNNQIFRIVIIPADFSSTGKSAKEDFSDYNAVIAKYNIDDTKVKKLN